MSATRGVVVSAKMTRAVVVRVEDLVQHPRYKKHILQRTRVKARDDLKCREGDVVELEQTRPLSRDIRWRVIRILGRRALAGGDELDPGTAAGPKAKPAPAAVPPKAAA